MKKILLILTIIAVQAFAGDKGNGGSGVDCLGEDLVTLDYYQATMVKRNGQTARLINVNSLSYEDIHRHINDRLRPITKFYAKYNSSKIILGSNQEWIEAPTDIPADSGKPYLLKEGCKEVGLAIQHDDIVYGNSTYLDVMSQGQLVLIELHEWLYNIAIHAGWNESAIVRKAIKEILKIDGEYSEYKLERILSELGKKVYINMSKGFDAKISFKYKTSCEIYIQNSLHSYDTHEYNYFEGILYSKTERTSKSSPEFTLNIPSSGSAPFSKIILNVSCPSIDTKIFLDNLNVHDRFGNKLKPIQYEYRGDDSIFEFDLSQNVKREFNLD